MVDASKLLAFANKLEDDHKEQGYKWLYDKLRYEIVRHNQTELNNNEVLDLVGEIDTELIVWINDTEKRAEMFKKAHHKDFEMVSSDFADAYRAVRDMIKEKSSR